MKSLLLFTLLIFFAGCGTAREMLSNTEQLNAKMEETIVVMTSVRETVLENTQGVERSTAEQKQFQKVNGSNMEVVKKVMGGTELNTVVPLAGIALLLLLFLPCFILGIAFFRLPRRR